MTRIFSTLLILLFTANLFAQSPEKMSYQTVIRNTDNKLIANQTIGIQISLLQGSANGSPVYTEIQKPKTNTNGLATLEIGKGSPVNGDFSSIDWSKGPYFLKTETDPSGGTNYSITGTCQLLSVPYALFAKTAAHIIGSDSSFYSNKQDKLTAGKGISIKKNVISVIDSIKTNETDPIYNISVAKAITTSDTSKWNKKQDKLTAGAGINIEKNKITTVNSIVLDNREICDGNKISISTGNIIADTLFGCTSFIDCKDVTEIEITEPVLSSTAKDGIAFYNANKTFISGQARTPGTANGVKTVTMPIPASAVYFRASYWNFANDQQYGAFKCSIIYPSEILGLGKYRPYQKELIHFRVKIDQSVPNSEQTTQTFKGSTAVLKLPDNYSSTGKPTKAIMYCHGMSRNVTYTEWGLNDSNFLAQKQRWVDKGFAVFDVNGQRDNKGGPINTNGTPQAVAAYHETYNYIIEHYNIDPEIYVVGGSMGGAVALNYCLHYSNVRALALLSAWTDLYACGWKNKVTDAFIEYFGFADATTYDADKVQGWNPVTRILTINNVSYFPNFKLPISLWIGEKEKASDLYQAALPFMQALRNGGNDAITHIVPNAGHELVSGGSLGVDLDVVRWLARF